MLNTALPKIHIEQKEEISFLHRTGVIFDEKRLFEVHIIGCSMVMKAVPVDITVDITDIYIKCILLSYVTILFEDLFEKF